jgi:uncharacterized membrane protein (Fun14 family)
MVMAIRSIQLKGRKRDRRNDRAAHGVSPPRLMTGFLAKTLMSIYDAPWFHDRPLSGDPLGAESSPGPVMQGGFAFLIGLAVGYAIKVGSRIALVVIGIAALSVLLLYYANLVDVRWGAIEVRYADAARWFAAEAKAFYDFLVQHISNAVSFMAGFALGMKR